MTQLISRYFDSEFAAGEGVWTRIGYHRAALGLRLGFFQGERESQCVAALKRHMLACFPNDPKALRLSDPAVANSRLITPYFGHFVMPELIQRGELPFVLDQYRRCWGWALGDDRTTWLEVFDTRWSHCHQWSGCPTWQLSRYVLGLQPRYDLGVRHYALSLVPSDLASVEGKLPLPGDSGVDRRPLDARSGRRALSNRDAAADLSALAGKSRGWRRLTSCASRSPIPWSSLL